MPVSKLGFFVIADPHTFLAFALTGLKGGAATDMTEARELLTRAREDPEVGLILITERLAGEIRREVDAVRREGIKPMVLEIPDLDGPVAKKESLLDRLRSLMGIPK